MIARLLFAFLLCLLVAGVVSASDTLSKEQVYSAFNQANDAFRQANSIINDTDKANSLY